MRKLKITLLLIQGLAIMNCTGQPKPKPDPAKKSSIAINSLKSMPAEIEGCSCYFSDSKPTFKKDQYIFAANFEGVAFLSINHMLQKFKITKSGRMPRSFGDYDHTDVYQNEFYTVTVNIKYIKSSGEETWLNEGTITIVNKSGEKLITSFYGECGC